MTERGKALVESVRATMQLLREHERSAPAEVDQIVAMIAADLRSWRPMSMTALDTGQFEKLDL